MFDNTLKLTKFVLKREKVNSTAWVLGLTIFTFLILLLLLLALMPSSADRYELMAMFENPALLAMVGPMHPVLGTGYAGAGYGFTLFMMVFIAIAVAIMNVFLVVRHTRADEEAGRYEVLRSLPSGRLANINAAMLSAVIVNVALTIGITLVIFIGMGVTDEGWHFAPALLWGVNMGVIGLVFAAIAALFSQLSSNSRGASGFSFLLLGIFYMTRAIADMDTEAGSEALALISPFGLISRTWPYVPEYFQGQAVVNNVWWPVLVILGMAAVFTALAYMFCSVRDIDQGIIPARPGKPKGGPLMKSAFGLNLRLTRLSIVVWVIILFAVAASYGTILDGIEDFVAGNETYRMLMLAPVPGLVDALDGASPEAAAEIMRSFLDPLGISVVQMFANMTGFIMAMIAAIPVLMFVLKAKSEEKAIRSELIIATPTSRTKYFSGYIIISFVTAALLMAAQALGTYALVPSLDLTDQLPLGFLFEASMVYVPALWLMGGLTALLVGLFPKRVNWIWAYYGFTFFALMYGRMLPDIDWLAYLTPMGWVPQLPVDEANWLVMAGMAVGGAALACAGIFFYKKRDINAITH